VHTNTAPMAFLTLVANSLVLTNTAPMAFLALVLLSLVLAKGTAAALLALSLNPIVLAAARSTAILAVVFQTVMQAVRAALGAHRSAIPATAQHQAVWAGLGLPRPRHAPAGHQKIFQLKTPGQLPEVGHAAQGPAGSWDALGGARPFFAHGHGARRLAPRPPPPPALDPPPSRRQMRKALTGSRQGEAEIQKETVQAKLVRNLLDEVVRLPLTVFTFEHTQ
jgi:hypothetical protein